MELKDAILILMVILFFAGMYYWLWRVSNAPSKKICPKCGKEYEGDRCLKCSRYCFNCSTWYEGDVCPMCTRCCPKCGNRYAGDFCPKCGKPVVEHKIGYQTENEEYAAEHDLWICMYCETLNEMPSGKKCICCGKSGAKALEKRSV